MKLQYRNELKFLCKQDMLESIENGVRTLCEPDPHAGLDGRYLIRSVYFDTPDDLYLRQTIDGVDDRCKYRIRIYDKSCEYINLERKESLHGKKRKWSYQLSVKLYDDIINDNLCKNHYFDKDSVLTDFLYERDRLLLEPKIIVEYLRTPFIYPIGNVRITFDRNITAAKPDDLFADALNGIDVLSSGAGILEVKYDDVLPGAIQRFLHGYDLQRVSFSKYVRCRKAMAGDFGEQI